MNFSLKPNTIIAHFLPGAFFLLAIAGMLALGNNAWLLNLSGPLVALLGGVGFPSALIVGLIFDAFRNSIVETRWDRRDKMAWDIFAHGEEKFRANLMDSYYGYYVFDVNLIIAIIVAVVASVFIKPWIGLDCSWALLGAALVVVVVLVLVDDARDLRKEMKGLIEEEMSKKAEEKNAEQPAT